MREISRFAMMAGFVAASIFAGAGALAQEVDMLDPGVGVTMEMEEGGSALQQFLAATGWVNQSGSVMNYTYSASGQITGTYINNAKGTGCQGTPFPLTGWINGNTIAWSVIWKNSTVNCNSVTAWGGYYSPTSKEIKTNWVLAVQSGSDETVQLGKDVFAYQ